MRKLFLFSMVFALTLTMGFGIALAGNGAPKGTHYNLNLLGKDNCPGDDLTGSNRHTIMVLLNFSDQDADNILGDDPGNYVTLDKRNKIFLAPGTDFQVTDGNACDRNGAGFTLPANVATAWTIWVRELGKPGGTGDIALCGVSDSGTADPSDDEVVCSTDQVLLVRDTGKSTFRNVTRQLTTIDYQILVGYEADGTTPIYVQDSAILFDSDFYQYLWDYDNNGLRLVQLRFYPVAQ